MLVVVFQQITTMPPFQASNIKQTALPPDPIIRKDKDYDQNEASFTPGGIRAKPSQNKLAIESVGYRERSISSIGAKRC